MFKTTLSAAINAASFVACKGYEVEHIEEMPDGTSGLQCSDELIARLDLRQEIEIDSDGEATAKDCNGEDANFEFRVSRPLTSDDL